AYPRTDAGGCRREHRRHAGQSVGPAVHRPRRRLMGPLAAKVAMSLGFDVLLRWVIRVLIALVVVALMVVIIVVQTVAGVLTGGTPGSTAGPTETVVPTPIAIPVPTGGLPVG